MRRKSDERRELWRERVALQERGGQSVRAFCRELGVAEHAFYAWRQRLRVASKPVESKSRAGQPGASKPVRFALVSAQAANETASPIELLLASGDRLRIPGDAATLRLVLGVLRELA